MSSPITTATTTNESCTLHYSTILPKAGTSPPLLFFVPGGAGHSTQFLDIMPYMTNGFQPATFSRRQHGLSVPLPGSGYVYLNPAQQARDVLAVVSALGFGSQKFYIFANSGGGLISLHLAVLYPDRVQHLIIHETPTISLLPDYDKIFDFLFEVHRLYLDKGFEEAIKLFRGAFGGYDDADPPLSRLGGEAEGDSERFLKYEILTMFFSPADLMRVRKNGTSVAVAYGKGSGDALYVSTTAPQAAVLGCERFEVPGDHTGYRYEPEAFARDLLMIYERLEAKSKENVGSEL